MCSRTLDFQEKTEEYEFSDIEDLAKLVFLNIYIEENTNNKIIINIPDMQNTIDYFCFCVELTLKGLSLLYGDPENNNKISLKNITIEQIQKVITRLKYCNIEMSLDIIIEDDEIYNNSPDIKDIIMELKNEKNNEIDTYLITKYFSIDENEIINFHRLKEHTYYIILINTPKLIFKINYDILRN
jgi:hypothetical protein